MHRPAFEMGGDYFDFVRVSEHRHGICIGDVAGKGIPASLPFMILRTLFKKFANGYNDPRQLVSDINKSLIHDLSPGTFITFLYCIYDSVEQKFLISNAGHCYPLYYDSLTKTITQLDTSGFVLGVFPDIDYETICLDFKPNDILILATDGVFDVKGPGKTMWGDDNFIEVIKKNADKAPYEIIASVLNEINSFRNNEKQFDDMAMIVIKNNKQ
jgi:sigma-B regulation protein RsbU (phosphoserine phosphatase)